ncbi:MAG: hypothetical protein K8T90_05445 [Planctomycetes bacterium]|nr:hypothetical protein [Planctomycetota bacterium]
MRFRYRVAVFVTGAALCVGSAYGVVTSDAFVRRLTRSVLSRIIRGPAHVESAAFSFHDGLVLHGVELRDPNDPAGPPAVLVDVLRADFGLFVLGDGPRVTGVVLENPTVRLRRLADGSLSVATLLEKLPRSDDAKRVEPPDVRITGATILYDDGQMLAGGPVVLSSVEAKLTPTGDAWRVDVTGTSKELGPLTVRAFISPDDEVTARVDLPAVVLGPALLARLRLPGAAETAAVAGRGTIEAHADVAWGPSHDAMVGAKVQLTGLKATVRLDETTVGERTPEAFDVTVTGGAAELKDAAVVLTGLEISALGATARFEQARLSGLGSGGTPQVDADLALDALVVNDALLPRLPWAARRVIDAYGLRGTIAGRFSLHGPVTSPSVLATADITAGHVSFDGYLDADGKRHGFPYAVNDASGTVSFDGSHLRFSAGGRHGPATIHADGVLDYRAGDELPDITIVAKDVPLDADLRAGFQDRAEHVFDRWEPTGSAASIVVRVVRDPHEDGPFGGATEIELNFDGRASLRPRLLPTTLSDVRGTILVLAPTRGDHRAERVVLKDVHAKGDGLDVTVSGRIDTDRAGADDDLSVTVHAADIGGAVRDAVLASTEFIPDSVKHLLTDLGARGAMTVRADVAGDPDRRRDRVAIALEGASVTGYRDVPFAADSLTGSVLVDGDEVRLTGIAGRALGVPIRGEGRLVGLATGAIEPDVRIEADQVPLGEPLRRALGPRLAKPAEAFWDRLRPVGEIGTLGTRADVVVAVRPSTLPQPIELWLTKIHGPLVPLGLEFDNEDGELHYDGREVTLRLAASIGGALIDLKRVHYDLASGRLGVSADLRGLRFPEDVDTLLPADTVARIREAIPGRNLHWNGLEVAYDPARDALDLSGELAIRPRARRAAPPPGLAPDGALQVEHLTFLFPPGLPVTFSAAGHAEGFRLRPGLQVEEFTGEVALDGRIDDTGLSVGASTIGARLVVSGFTLTDAKIQATSAPDGARVTAEAGFSGGRLTAALGPGTKDVAYSGQLHLRGADLAKVVGSRGDVRGVMDGDASFNNASGRSEDLRGTFELNVREGALVKFPLVSAVLNVIPGAGDLTDAALHGTIRGATLDIRSFVVRGPILKLYDSTGWIGFDGALNIDLSAFWGVPLASLPIHVGGTLRSPQVNVSILGSGTPKDKPREPEPREPESRGDPAAPGGRVW